MTTRTAAPRADAASWIPQVAVGTAVLVVGTVLTLPQHRYDATVLGLHLALVVGYAVAAALSRRLSGWSLGVAAVTGIVQAVTGAGLLAAQLALLVVVYGAARWGRTPVLVLSAAAIGFGAVVGGLRLDSLKVTDDTPAAGDSMAELLLTRAAYWHSSTLVILGAVLLACAWVSGLAVRMRERALRSDQERLAAELAVTVADETARVQAAQAELARDVHDVVGHSLAVILAQAEAARVLDDPDRVRQMLGHIVDTTRSSLRDVRGVLTDTATPPGDLDGLLAGVAASRQVEQETTGPARSLPPELQLVAHRVLQELLTNALRHSTADSPIRVGIHWEPDRLTLVVVNDAVAVVPSGGNGIPGMRRRLAAVGGFFHLHHDGAAATATASIPLRPGSAQ